MTWYIENFDFAIDHRKNKLELTVSFCGHFRDKTVNAISSNYGANSKKVAKILNELEKWCDDFENPTKIPDMD